MESTRFLIVAMLSKSVFVILMLVLSTAFGIGLALFGRDRWMVFLFWGCAQFLPVFYILLAWRGSRFQEDEEVTKRFDALSKDQVA
jgi:hypothetical protein